MGDDRQEPAGDGENDRQVERFAVGRTLKRMGYEVDVH